VADQQSKHVGDPINDAIYGKHGIKQGIEACFKSECYVSALILIFSAVDAMSNLIRPEGRDENTKADFIAWARRYMRLKEDTEVSPDELWSARNALVHTYGAESKDTRKGVRLLLWAVGGSKKVKYVPKLYPKFVMVDIGELSDQFYAGLDRFLVYTHEHPEKRKLMEKRLPGLLVAYDQDMLSDIGSGELA
jgi:hypothetical protein